MFKKKKDKMFVFKNKLKSTFKNQKQYKIFESKQLQGILLIVIFSFLMIVSIVQVRGFSTINSYTVGMLFGYYSYFIYVGFIVLGLCYLFQINVLIEKYIASKFNKKVYFSWLPYLFFALGIALITESIIQIVNNKTVFPGGTAFKNFFVDWWNDFTHNSGQIANSNPALPGIMNSGMVTALFMSLIVSWSGYVISIIIGLVFVVHFFYYIFYGSLIQRIRVKVFGDPNKKDKISKQEFEEYKTKIMDLSFEDSFGIIDKPNDDLVSNVKAKTTTISIENSDNMFPIDNSIDHDFEKEQTDFINLKTNQINIEKNKTKEFKLEDLESKNNISADDTFKFELDIFDSETN